MRNFLILFLLIAVSIYSQQKKITFEVLTDKIDDTSSVYITGNHAELGEWNPSVMMLNKKENNKWSITLPFSINTTLEFKFTLGSWGNEALDENGNAQKNKILVVKNDTTVTFSVKKWGEQKNHRFFGQITGNVKYHRNMTGDKIKSRDIIVWLPPNYESNKDKRYPVLYANDGQNLVDPSSSAFGVDWQIDETADSLIRQGKMEEIIIVGIYNTTDRTKEYMTMDTGYAYMNFIVNKLKPFIDSSYRTLPDRANTAIMGSSSGGTISFMLHWVHNDVFGKAACLSPAFKVFNYDVITPYVNEKAEHKDLRLYMDDGGHGIDEKLIPGIKEMVKALKLNGYKEDKNYEFLYFPDDDHNEISWAKRLSNPLIYMFKKE